MSDPTPDRKNKIAMLLRRVQPRNRIADFRDRRAGRNWYAPVGTYDGVKGGRPARRIVCHVCGGRHRAGGLWSHG